MDIEYYSSLEWVYFHSKTAALIKQVRKLSCYQASDQDLKMARLNGSNFVGLVKPSLHYSKILLPHGYAE